jgi:long-chain fatty acid transport protein
MKNQRIKLFFLALLLLLAAWFPATAWAGGAYLYEISLQEVGLASAGWSARAQDASTAFTNPAGMTRLERSELLVGIQPMYQNVEFSHDSDTTVKGKDGDASDWLPSGSVYYVHSLSPDVKLGIGILDYFGLDVDYDDDWVGRYYAKELSWETLTIMPSVAYRVNEWLSLGAGVNVMYGTYENTVAVNNVLDSLPDGELKVEHSDWGFGANLGILIEPVKDTRFGLTYLTEVNLDIEDKPGFEGLGPGLSLLLGNAGLLKSEIELGMTAPQMVMFSAYHDLNDTWAIMGNFSWQDWSEFGKVDVLVSSPDTGSLLAVHDYEDTWHVAAGVQYRASDFLLLSTGVAYDSALFDDDDRSLDLPLGESWRFGAGAQYQWKENIALGLAYELLWLGDLPADVNRGSLSGRVSGEFSDTHTHFAHASLNWRF